MPLPSSKRVVFRRNPLFAVSVQVRVHPILRIQVEPPVEFQEAIRTSFPGYQVTDPVAIGMPAGVPTEIQAILKSSIQTGLPISFAKVHRFDSSDGKWIVSLSQEAIVMACSEYPRWEEYRERFRPVFDAFVATYRPPFALSVGLRYQNAIERSKLGLGNVRWEELLSSFIAAEFGCEGLLETDVVSDLHRFEFKEGPDRILVQHGMAKNQLTQESVYSIDSNLNSSGKVELNDVFARLDQLNKHSGSLFRLCIKDRLFSSLEPVDA